MSLLSDLTADVDHCVWLTIAVEHHRPCQPCDFASPVSGFKAKQDDGAVSDWIPRGVDVLEQPANIYRLKHLCRLPDHTIPVLVEGGYFSAVLILRCHYCIATAAKCEYLSISMT